MSDIVWTNTRVRLGDLKPWSDNPRLSTKAQARRLLASFEKFGQVQTVAIDPDCNVLDGHQRLSALLTIHGGDYELDARQSNRALSDAERRELVVSLHAGAVGSWDWDKVSGWSVAELNEWGMDKDLLKSWNNDANNLKELIASEQAGGADAEPQTDRAAELLEKWQVKESDVWLIGEHKLLCGSSLDRENVARLFGDERARLTWTDPPYGVKYGDKMEASNPMGYRVRQIENDDLPPEELEGFIRTALKNAAEFSVAGAAIYVASPAGTPLPSLIKAFEGSGFDYRWGLIWLKDQIVLSRADYHFKHENLLYGWKSGGAHYFTSDRTQSSVFEYPRPKVSEEHPTMKPVELVRHMMRNSSEKGDIVYDAFGGSGSTMLAAENEGRRCRMIELEPKFCSVILERMSTAFPSIAIKRLEGV
jgi:DNA modification methylase